MSIFNTIFENNKKTYALGKVESGTFSENDHIIIMPEQLEDAIEEIYVYGQDCSLIDTQQSAAMILKDNVLKRGHVVTKNLSGNSSDILHILMFCLSDEPLDDMVMRIGTQERSVVHMQFRERVDSYTLEIIEKNPDSLNFTDIAYATVKMKTPIFFENKRHSVFNRCVLLNKNKIYSAGVIIQSE